MKCLFKLVAVLVVVVMGLGIYVASGSYNIGADSPHWPLARQLLGVLREHSIAARAGRVQVPRLDDPALIREGAGHYAGMCTGCHLAPGMQDSELRAGLYPTPPDLTRSAPDPAKAFWVIKHGIKLTAMPAWGKTHDDRKIWALVAFLQRLPTLSARRYAQLHAAGDAVDQDQQHVGAVKAGIPPAGTASIPAPAVSTSN